MASSQIDVLQFAEVYRDHTEVMRETGEGMYGRCSRFVSTRDRLMAADDRYFVRVCTIEHARAISQDGVAEVVPCERMKGLDLAQQRQILSALRMTPSPSFRQQVIRELKRLQVLSNEFCVSENGNGPVPGTISFTTPSNFAKTFRVFCNRMTGTWFASNMTILILDGRRLQNIMGHFRTHDESAALSSSLSTLLPDFDETLMNAWKEGIQKCSFTLMESHVYKSINVAEMMERGDASILFFGGLPLRHKIGLSRAAYVKVIEKKSDFDSSRIEQQTYGTHSDILYPALANALSKVRIYSPMAHIEDVMTLMQLSVTYEVEHSLYRFALQHYQKPYPRSAHTYETFRLCRRLWSRFYCRGTSRTQALAVAGCCLLLILLIIVSKRHRVKSVFAALKVAAAIAVE